MKRWLMLLAAALMLLSASALAEPVQLDYTTIIDGETVYYSGSIDGGETGVFVMNADGSDPVRISSETADLLALSNGNLLVCLRDMDTGDFETAVLLDDGTVVPLGADYGSTAISADGRFYWGAGSCAADGTDIQHYFTGDDVNAYDYYPLDVQDGWLYYLDWSEMNGQVGEGWDEPTGATLCRMNLSSLSCELISDVGTSFLALEDGVIYYTRTNFWLVNEDYSDYREVTVDQGLFCADLDTLTEKRLASPPENSDVWESYTLAKDGIVYGLRSDFTTDENGVYSIIRVQADGTVLPAFVLEECASLSLRCVENGVLYAAECIIESSEDDFIQKDRIIAINSDSGERTVLNPSSLDMLFYSEAEPAVAAVNNRLYFTAYDMERWSVCLKAMDPDGSNLRLLAHGISQAEG